MTFEKWEGLGNDFLFLEGEPPAEAPQRARRWCARRTGVGADGLVYLGAGPRMVIFNSDGSRPQMCGNAVRCIGGRLHARGELEIGRWITLETDSGPRQLRVLSRREEVWQVEVDMGRPLPIDGFPPLLPIPEVNLPGHFVSMGNPHLVVLCPEGLPDRADFERWGSALTGSTLAPKEGVNVEFVARDGDGLKMWVWERGAGPTEACGTGACAALVVAVRVGWIGGSARVNLPGGDLQISWNGQDSVFMAGPAHRVFSGQIQETGVMHASQSTS